MWKQKLHKKRRKKCVPSPIPDGVEVIEISDSEEDNYRDYYSFDDVNDVIESTGPFTVTNTTGIYIKIIGLN